MPDTDSPAVAAAPAADAPAAAPEAELEAAPEPEPAPAATNVKLTLTCGNAKCAQVITTQVVTSSAAPNVEHMMATQQIQCPNCSKVGRNHVTKELTSDGTYLKHQRPVAADVPRRHKEDFNRKMITPPERGMRRRGTRAAGKEGPPPMSQRQLEKLQRRGQAETVLGPMRGRTEPERSRTNQPQVPTPQPTAAQPIPLVPTPAAVPVQPRTRANGRNASAPAVPTRADPTAT